MRICFPPIGPLENIFLILRVRIRSLERVFQIDPIFVGRISLGGGGLPL